MIGRVLSTSALARACARYPWVPISVWAAVIIAAGVLISGWLGGALTTEDEVTTNPDSRAGRTLLAERSPESLAVSEVIVVRSDSYSVETPRFREFVEDLRRRIEELGPHAVAFVGSYYLTGDESLVSASRRATLVPVSMAGSFDAAVASVEEVHEIVDAAAADPDFEVFQTGRATISRDFHAVSERDLQKAEAVGIPIAVVILVLVFGTLVAALVPVLLAGVSIAAALGATALLGQALDLSLFVVNMITMMGLAVGIDYSLFIVSRYREERANGLGKIEAISATGGTASRAVLFSGLTVVVALLGLLLVPVNVFRSLSTGAILVVVAAVLASLTLLPALLSLVGDRINSLRVPLLGRLTAEVQRDRGSRVWDFIARAVMRRPVLSLTLAGGLLVAAAAPAFGISIGATGVSAMPEGTRSRDAFDVLEQEFAAGAMTPTEIVVDGQTASPELQAALAALTAMLEADADFGPVAVRADPSVDLAVLTVHLLGDTTSSRAVEAVKRLRAEYVPRAFAGTGADVYVTGRTAGNVDFFAITNQYTPIVFGFVLGVSFLLLTFVFRSLVVPAKAILMNMLSVGAAYGLIVLVSQHGVGAELLGFRQVESVDAWIPLFMFAVLFGLSMDYHVFLLSRIRERFGQTRRNTESVAFGLRSTGALITGAAAIMIAVFGGFAAGDLVMFQQFGFGLAVAVFLDATLVRSVLVPASMRLLGAWNWYLPSFLRWLPEVRIEAHQVGKPPTESVPAAADTSRL